MEKQAKKNHGKVLQIVENLPDAPGVYKMKDSDGRVLYVGKAKNLKKRVKSYFQREDDRGPRIKKLISQTADIETMVTDTELEAYVLETNLIKELRPKYNILMRDDKNFVYIKIWLQEDFPRISIVRKIEKDGAKYIGPKTAASKVYETLRALKKLFPFRHCRLDIADAKTGEGDFKDQKFPVKVTNRIIDYPCLDFFIKRCQGPCAGAISKEDYRKTIDQIINFLEGKGEDLIKNLNEQMADYAANKKFEQAARIRDKLSAISEILEHQKISDPERVDTDIINYHIEAGRVFLALFLIRGGKLLNQENFMLDAFEVNKTGEISIAEILEAFIKPYYEKAADILKEILLPEEIHEQELFESFLSALKSEKVKILFPQRGEKNKLLELCRKNAEHFASQSRIRFMAAAAEREALSDLVRALEMKDGTMLKRIECYDISHTGGQDTVGSMVVFENGFPKKDHYRHFKIRTVSGKPDDFSSMKETLSRRLKYLAKEDKTMEFRLGVKKDIPFIIKISKKLWNTDEEAIKKDFSSKQFLAAVQNKEIVGFCLLKKLEKNINALEYLWVKESLRGKKLGHRIVNALLDKKKVKRAYVYAEPEMESYYAEMGFILLQSVPEALKNRAQEEKWVKKPIYLVLDRIKHKPDPSFITRPDLIMVDGGKPQLSAALQALQQYDLNIPVMALAKRLEEIYIPGKDAPLLLEEGESALKLLQRIRDEAHRFAITFGRELHRKTLIHQ